jgi:hypothetical protein
MLGLAAWSSGSVSAYEAVWVVRSNPVRMVALKM